MKCHVVILLFLLQLTSYPGFSQTVLLDSLKSNLSGANSIQKQIPALYDLGIAYNFIDADTGVAYGSKGYQLAEDINDSVWIARMLIPLSSSLAVQGNYPLAIHDIFASISYFERHNAINDLANATGTLTYIYKEMGDYDRALKTLRNMSTQFPANPTSGTDPYSAFAFSYDKAGNADSSLYYAGKTIAAGKAWSGVTVVYANAFARKSIWDSALHYYRLSIAIAAKDLISKDIIESNLGIADVYHKMGRNDSALTYIREALNQKSIDAYPFGKMVAYQQLADVFATQGKIDSAYTYLRKHNVLREKLFAREKQNTINNIVLAGDLLQKDIEKARKEYEAKVRQNILISGMVVLLLATLLLIWGIRQKQKTLHLVNLEKQEAEIQRNTAETTLQKLVNTQKQLVQSEKLAFLGELTAGIAHEIQNPLNFVNNFSDINGELISDLKKEIDKGNKDDIKSIAEILELNSDKISHHGKRADAIVKSMLQHARPGSGNKEQVNINTLVLDSVNLAYNMFRSKDSHFIADIRTNFDPSIDTLFVSAQDISKILVNICNNAFYAMREKAGSVAAYSPVLTLTSSKIPNTDPNLPSTHLVQISIQDNGTGIDPIIKDKIFQPFVTTKPTGHGTGLGLSLAFDMVVSNGGSLSFTSIQGVGTTFYLLLPC